MPIIKPGHKKLYATYFVGVTCIFLYLLFPVNRIKTHISGMVNRANPEYRLTIGSLRPAFPVALMLKELQLDRQGVFFADADSLTLRPHLRSLFSSHKKVDFKCLAFDGKVTGTIEFDESDPGQYHTMTSKLSDLQLLQMPVIQNSFNFDLSGTLSGNLRLYRESGTQIEGLLDAYLENAAVMLEAPLFDVGQLTFQSFESTLSWKGDQVEISQANFTGPELDGSITGTVQILDPAGASQLNLDISVKPRRILLSKLQGVLPFITASAEASDSSEFQLQLTGTWDNPRVALK